jgi:hypothetical protein
MALISCPKCDRRINETTEACRHCGHVLEAGFGASEQAKSQPSAERKVTYPEAKSSLEDRVYKALLAAGKPPLVYRGGAITWRDPLTEEQFQAYALAFLGPEAGGIWKAAGMPDINTFIAGLEEQFGNLLDEPEADRTRLIESDREFKAWGGSQAFKLWKKRGRPPVVIVDEQTAMYQVQWEFEQLYGYSMDSNMLEAWYWVGCPDLRTWDVAGTMEQYNALVMELYEAGTEILSNGVAGVFEALGDGIRQVADSLESAQSSSSNSVDELRRAMGQQQATPPAPTPKPQTKSSKLQEQDEPKSWGSGKSFYHACRSCGSPNNVNESTGGWPRKHWWKCMTCGHREEFVP